MSTLSWLNCEQPLFESSNTHGRCSLYVLVQQVIAHLKIKKKYVQINKNHALFKNKQGTTIMPTDAITKPLHNV